MKIKIVDTTVVQHLQDAFHDTYPYLWLDLYYPAHSRQGIFRPEKVEPHVRLNNLPHVKLPLTIDIRGDLTIREFEQRILDLLGLKVEVLRRSSNVWVPTRYTIEWTLDNQNFEGKQIVI